MYNELIKELIIKLLDRLKNGEDTVDSHFFRLNKIRKSLDYNDEIKALILKVNNYYLENKRNKEEIPRDLTGLIILFSYDIPYKSLNLRTLAYLGDYTGYMSLDELDVFSKKISNNIEVLNILVTKIEDNDLRNYLLDYYDDYNLLKKELDSKSVDKLIIETSYQSEPEMIGGISI